MSKCWQVLVWGGAVFASEFCGPLMNDRSLRNRRWLLAALVGSVTLNVAGVVLYLMRDNKPQRPDIYRGDRQTMFEDLTRHPTETVLLGDSLTDRGEWHELLDRPVANRGISGDTIAGATARLAPIQALRPKTLAIMLGVNDLLSGRSVAECTASYTQLLAAVKRFDPPPRIIVQSVLPVRDVGLSNEVIRQLDDRLRALCAAQGCEYLDLVPAFAAPDGSLQPAFTNDGVHLTGAAYRKWAELLAPAL
jgi:lysophospholipase L1-like esterase